MTLVQKDRDMLIACAVELEHAGYKKKPAFLRRLAADSSEEVLKAGVRVRNRGGGELGTVTGPHDRQGIWMVQLDGVDHGPIPYRDSDLQALGCNHPEMTLTGDGNMTCDRCGFTEADPFYHAPDGRRRVAEHKESPEETGIARLAEIQQHPELGSRPQVGEKATVQPAEESAPSQPSELERFRLHAGFHSYSLVPDPEGEYMRFEDHQKLLEEARESGRVIADESYRVMAAYEKAQAARVSAEQRERVFEEQAASSANAHNAAIKRAENAEKRLGEVRALADRWENESRDFADCPDEIRALLDSREAPTCETCGDTKWRTIRTSGITVASGPCPDCALPEPDKGGASGDSNPWLMDAVCTCGHERRWHAEVSEGPGKGPCENNPDCGCGGFNLDVLLFQPFAAPGAASTSPDSKDPVEPPSSFAELRDRFIDPEKEQLRAEVERLKAACGHPDTKLNGDGSMTCEVCGHTVPDLFYHAPDGRQPDKATSEPDSEDPVELRERLRIALTATLQNWVDHHRKEAELAEISDAPDAAKQHEIAADAFEDAIRFALQALDKATSEPDSEKGAGQ